MKYLVLMALVLSSQAFSKTFDLGVLNEKSIRLGDLSQDQNQAVRDVIVFNRTAQTPKKVEVTYSFNYLDRTCVDYKIKSKFIKGFSKIVCEKSGGGTHNCRIREFPGFDENERVCSDKGYELKNKKVTATFNFKSAIPLNEDAIETFTLALTQKKMKTNSVKFELTSIDSIGVYKLSKLGNNYYFKLK